MNNNNNDKPKFNNNVQISWGKRTKAGFISDEIKADKMDQIFQALTPGAKIAIRSITCTNKKTGEGFESAVFEIISAEDVLKFKAQQANKNGGAPSARQEDTNNEFLT